MVFYQYDDEELLIDPKTIDTYLYDANFPAVKEELLAEAESVEAPEYLVSFLENIPDREYSSPQDLYKFLNIKEADYYFNEIGDIVSEDRLDEDY